MWQLAEVISNYDPIKALPIARQSLILAEKEKYDEGISRSMGIVANTLINIGNYPQALDYCFKKLEMEESRQNYRNLASAYMNIGIVYVYQEEFQEALRYYYLSDSVIRRHSVSSLEYYSAQNLGDIYDRLNRTDSSLVNFSRALSIADSLQDKNFMAASITGIGHCYRKLQNFAAARHSYQLATNLLREADNNDLLCEALLGAAQLYRQNSFEDSAAYFARLSFATALQSGFISRQLDAADFMGKHFAGIKNFDSAFLYMDLAKTLNDSINGRNRIRELQVLTSNEQLRQIEMEESRQVAAEERRQQLQLLFIGIFIPGFFLLTLLLSRSRVNPKFIKLMGILSLLFLFEFLTLLLHPRVAELTHHTPIYELLIFVAIAAILIPAHHRIEHWLIKKLSYRKKNEARPPFVIRKSKLKLKQPPLE